MWVDVHEELKTTIWSKSHDQLRNRAMSAMHKLVHLTEPLTEPNTDVDIMSNPMYSALLSVLTLTQE